jgi:hypothetical protein
MSARGPMLTLRLRNGALLRVDATEAFASGSVSAPLFAGKSTVVKGTFSTRATRDTARYELGQRPLDEFDSVRRPTCGVRNALLSCSDPSRLC